MELEKERRTFILPFRLVIPRNTADNNERPVKRDFLPFNREKVARVAVS